MFDQFDPFLKLDQSLPWSKLVFLIVVLRWLFKENTKYFLKLVYFRQNLLKSCARRLHL